MGDGLIRFTLDTNCLIDVDEERPNAVHVRRLLSAGRRGEADLAMVASSASERQPGGVLLESIALFRARKLALGFDSVPLLPPLGRFGVGFWGDCLFGSPESVAREALIYRTLFPTSQYEWADFAHSHGIDPANTSSKPYFLWRNKLLDAQAYWAHEHHGRDVFVSSDRAFQALLGHPDFPSADIRDPSGAAALL